MKENFFFFLMHPNENLESIKKVKSVTPEYEGSSAGPLELVPDQSSFYSADRSSLRGGRGR